MKSHYFLNSVAMATKDDTMAAMAAHLAAIAALSAARAARVVRRISMMCLAAWVLSSVSFPAQNVSTSQSSFLAHPSYSSFVIGENSLANVKDEPRHRLARAVRKHGS